MMGVAAALAGCGGGGGNGNPTVEIPKSVLPASPSPAPSPTVAPVTGAVSATGRYQDLVFTLTAPKQVYGRGENVPLTFTVQNGSQEAVFNYSNLAGAPYNGDILDADGNFVRGRIIYGFAGADDGGGGPKLRIAAGKTETYTMKWDQLNQSHNAQVLPGVYRIRGFIDAISSDPAVPNGDLLSTDYLEVTVK